MQSALPFLLCIARLNSVGDVEMAAQSTLAIITPFHVQ